MNVPVDGPAEGGDELVDGDTALVAGLELPSERTPLGRERIVAAAIDYVDQSGLPGLTMRHLGSVLGVEAMSLYRYVSGKDELLDAIVDAIVEDLDHDDEVLAAPRDGWQDFLQRLAHGMRRVALAHPNAFPLIVSRPPEAPWLRPPIRSLRWVQAFLDAMSDEGFSDQAAVASYRAFTSFLLGHLLLEVATLGADVGPLDVLEDQSEPLGDLADYPTVRRLSADLAQNRSADEFEAGLEELLDRLHLLRTQQSG